VNRRRTVVALGACPLSGIDADDLLLDLAWRAIRDWRRRRDVDPASGVKVPAVRRAYPSAR